MIAFKQTLRKSFLNVFKTKTIDNFLTKNFNNKT
jgi:hypothetical protein